MTGRPQHLEVEQAGESLGYCDCCGRTSRCVWGYVHEAQGPTLAVYYVRWTDGHLEEVGAEIDLFLGAWGDDASSADTVAVTLRYRLEEGGPGSFMIIDADPKPDIAAAALKRDEVIGTPVAPEVFRLIDTIWEQDRRFF